MVSTQIRFSLGCRRLILGFLRCWIHRGGWLLDDRLGILRRVDRFNELLDLLARSARTPLQISRNDTYLTTRDTDLEEVGISWSILFVYLPRKLPENLADQFQVLC